MQPEHWDWIHKVAEIGAMIGVIITLGWSAGKVGKRMGELQVKLESHIKSTDKVYDEMQVEVRLIQKGLDRMDYRVDQHTSAISRLQGFIDAVNILKGNGEDKGGQAT